MKRLLSVSPGGVYTYHDYDDLTGKTTIAVVQDCEPTLELNKARQSLAEQHRKERKAGWHCVASIPVGVQHKWLVDHGINLLNPDHQPAVKRLLNSSEYAYLRTAPGNL